MTTFQNGPAKGQALSLQRAPVFLRVVEKQGKWDALDQLEETPDPEEKIYVYLIVGNSGMYFMDGRGTDGRRRGWSCVMATYRFYEIQPEDSVMRENPAWQKWCHEEGKRLTL